MTALNRRDFLRGSATAAGRAVAGLTALNAFSSSSSGSSGVASANAAVRPEAQAGQGGYGRLHEAGPELLLPKGFSYRVIGVEDSMMSDGHKTPGRHDGMAAFPLPNGNIRLIRNHEVDNPPALNACLGSPLTAYDEGAGGGTTSLEIHPETREVVRDFVSLSGTWRNCAGGPTPWGSWLSCEEAFFGWESGFGQPHGYVFEVPSHQEELERIEPLTALGRFVHEAVAIDPATGIVYQTEDLFRAGFYRFIPHEPHTPARPGNLRAGGRLQMLAVKGSRQYDTRREQRIGRPMPVTWVPIDDVDPQGGPDDRSFVFEQGFAQGGARFSRLEGCWYGDGKVYIVATDGGSAQFGQVWQYTPTGPDSGLLTLIFESPHQNVLNRPDNVCVSPRGAVLVCEDGHARRQYVRGLTSSGRIFNIACNVGDESELAGVTFSPDGRTMFFNSQGNRERNTRAKTFAVWGPWRAGAV